MAKKGQEFQKHTPEFKQKIIEEYLIGADGHKRLAKKYGISHNTIPNWIKKYRKEGFEGFYVDKRSKNKVGRPKSKKIDYEGMSDKEKITYLEMEVEILKKLKVIQKKNQK
ncbi:transposase [Mycoplasmatota bacterium zrk1]